MHRLTRVARTTRHSPPSLWRQSSHQQTPPAIWHSLPGSHLSRRAVSTLPNIPIFQSLCTQPPNSPAIIHSRSQEIFTYGRLCRDILAAKKTIKNLAKGHDLQGERVAFMANPGYEYTVQFLAILALQAVALPLAPGFPEAELRYIVQNGGVSVVLATEEFGGKVQGLEGVTRLGIENGKGVGVVTVGGDGAGRDLEGEQEGEQARLIESERQSGGLMLYTSGTTSRPKGVVLKESVITAQARSLVKAWNYSPTDLLLHVLPLHHIHGVINALYAPLLAGCAVEFLSPFNANDVWKRLARPFVRSDNADAPEVRPVSIFTAVPTIYNMLLGAHPSLDQQTKEASIEAISPKNLRLNISGSAPLTPVTKGKWTELSRGNVLLERYGMTETGMILSCGLDPADRVDGSVGWPLPGVDVRLVDPETDKVLPVPTSSNPSSQALEGEIQVRGPTIFSEYWQNPSATTSSFVEVEASDDQGPWFRTGDIASHRLVPQTGQSPQEWTHGPMYFIHGRQSTDILKSGGEKVSALEVENALLSLPQIAEAAVIGVPSAKWGQKIVAVVVFAKNDDGSRGREKWGALEMRRALGGKLARYKIPQAMKVVEREGGLRKNAMGKVSKKELVREYGDGS